MRRSAPSRGYREVLNVVTPARSGRTNFANLTGAPKALMRHAPFSNAATAARRACAAEPEISVIISLQSMIAQEQTTPQRHSLGGAKLLSIPASRAGYVQILPRRKLPVWSCVYGSLAAIISQFRLVFYPGKASQHQHNEE